jgi:hypothetical protein
MKARFKTAALILAGITALALIFLAAQRVIAVARVQNSVSRGWEIKFESQGRPAALPAWADDATGSFFDWAFGHTKGTSNLQIIHRERFQALFRGPITEIGIYEPHEFKADALAFALRQFPSLRRLAIETGISTPIAADWKVLSASLRALPRLEELTLWSGDITDTDLAPLAGHPNLRSVKEDRSRPLALRRSPLSHDSRSSPSARRFTTSDGSPPPSAHASPSFFPVSR